MKVQERHLPPSLMLTRVRPWMKMKARLRQLDEPVHRHLVFPLAEAKIIRGVERQRR